MMCDGEMRGEYIAYEQITARAECLDCDTEVFGPLVIQPWERDGVPGLDIGIKANGRAHRVLIVEVHKRPPKGNGNAKRTATS